MTRYVPRVGDMVPSEQQTLGTYYLAADVDAALVQVTEERDEQCAGKMAFFGGMNDMREQRTTLERQLTKVTSEKQSHMDCINLLATHIGRLGETSHAVVDAAIQQLRAMTEERDEAVRIAKMLMEPSPVTEADVKWAQDMLAAKKHQEGLP